MFEAKIINAASSIHCLQQNIKNTKQNKQQQKSNIINAASNPGLSNLFGTRAAFGMEITSRAAAAVLFENFKVSATKRSAPCCVRSAQTFFSARHVQLFSRTGRSSPQR